MFTIFYIFVKIKTFIMRNIKFSKILFNIAFLVYICQNCYFGWNKLPMSEAEVIADKFTALLYLLSFIIYILPLFKVYENYIRSKGI